MPAFSRDELLEYFDRNNRTDRIALTLQILAIPFVIWLIDWPAAVEQPLISVVAVLVVTGPNFLQMLLPFASRQVEIRQLKETTKFGEYNKDRLHEIYQQTCWKLGRDDSSLPFFIRAGRDMNAHSLHLGFGKLFDRLQGISVNRQLLYRVQPDELQSIIGHELGHFDRYYMISQRYHAVLLLLGSLLGILVWQSVGTLGLIGYIICFAVAAYFWRLVYRQLGKTAQVIEFLCDDYGAQASSVEASINTLLIMGMESEMLRMIFHKTLLAHSKKLTAGEISRQVLDAIPYGYASDVEVEEAVGKALKKQSERKSELSVRGFLDYAWNGGSSDEEQLAEAEQKFAAEDALPRIDWEYLRPDAAYHRGRLTAVEIEQLVELMSENPGKVLFRLIDEEGTHPSYESRIVTLWENREEIEAEAKLRTSNYGRLPQY